VARGDVTGLAIGSATVPPGATVTLEVVAEATAPGIGAYTIDVGYDPGLLEAVGCVPGGDGLSICNPVLRAGVVRLTGAAPGGLTGRVVLGGVVFKARETEGTSELNLAVVQLAGPDGTPVAASPQKGSVTVKAGAEVSAPPTRTGGPTVVLASEVGTPAGAQVAQGADGQTGDKGSGGSSPVAWLLAAAGLAFVAGGIWAVSRMQRRS
jgi:hypothetical protein